MKKNLTKLLMLLGVFLFLGAGNAFAWKIYFTNPDKWNPPYCFVKKTENSTEYNNSWPGKPMSKDNATGLWYIDNNSAGFNDPPQVVIFSTEGHYQTVDLSFKDGAVYTKTGQTTDYPTIVPATLFLMGDASGVGGFIPNKGLQATPTDCIYTWNNVTFNGSSGKSYFSFASKLGSGDKDWDTVNSSVRYGAPSENYGVSKSTYDITIYSSKPSDSKSWEIANGTYNITVNLQTNKLTISEGAASPTSYSYLLRGDFGKSWNNYTLKNHNGVWTSDPIKVANVENGVFGIRAFSNENEKNSENAPWYFANANNRYVQVGTPMNTILKNGSNGDNFLIKPGKYQFQFNASDKTLTVISVPEEISWVLRGDVDGTWRDYPFIRSKDDINIWTVSLPGVTGKNFGLKKLVDGDYDETNKDLWFTNGSATISESNPTVTLGTVTTSNTNVTFGLDPKKIYTLTWNAKTHKLTVAQAEHVYMFGHINGGSWDRGNLVELTYNPSSKWYETTFAYVKGQWNERDKQLVPGRKLWGSTNNENYVAFYPQIPTEKDFDRDNVNHMKFGYAYDGNCGVEMNTWYKYSFREEKTNNNFKVADGYYKVEFDAANQQVRFTTTTETIVDGKIVKTFSWYSGDDSNDDKDSATRCSLSADGSHYTYSFTYGEDAKNVVQVALYSNPKHDAARQALFTVKKKTTTPSNSGAGVKSKLNEGVYEDAEPTDESYGGDYRIEGTAGFDDNRLIHLYNPGEYLITAHMNPNAVDENNNKLSDTYTINDSYIIVTVSSSSSEVIVNKKEDDVAERETGNDDFIVRQAFSPRGENEFKGLIEVIEDLRQDQFEVTLTPAFTSVPWESTSEEDRNKLDNAYFNALKGVEYKYATQGNGLYELYSLLGVDHDEHLVDGFYRDGTIEVSVKEMTTPITGYNPTDGYKAYDVTFKGIPCSGVYTMKVTSKIPDQYDIKPNETTVYIYPNLTAEYGTRYDGQGENVVNYGFNVEGFTLTNDDSNEVSIIKINSSFMNNNKDNMGALSCFMPGTYFASEFTATSGQNPYVSKPNAVKRNASYAAGDYTSEAITNLSALKDGVSDNLSVYVKKNGAQAKYNFVVAAQEGGNVATGIDSVEAVEDGEAVYYNLQGVKVQNPEHGIYVKVQNGKAEKVVL